MHICLVSLKSTKHLHTPAWQLALANEYLFVEHWTSLFDATVSVLKPSLSSLACFMIVYAFLRPFIHAYELIAVDVDGRMTIWYWISLNVNMWILVIWSLDKAFRLRISPCPYNVKQYYSVESKKNAMATLIQSFPTTINLGPQFGTKWENVVKQFNWLSRDGKSNIYPRAICFGDF